jgi:hypothetical protein
MSFCFFCVGEDADNQISLSGTSKTDRIFTGKPTQLHVLAHLCNVADPELFISDPYPTFQVIADPTLKLGEGNIVFD